MPTSSYKALERLRGLATAQECENIASQTGELPRPFAANTHIHLPPNFSAFRDAKQAVGLAADEGLRVLGTSNYYDFGVYGEFAAECLGAGIFPLFGVEIIALVEELARGGVKVNDPGNPGKMYICGKGITRFEKMSGAAERLIGKIRRNDEARLKAMTERLAEIFERNGVRTGLDDDSVIDLVVRRTGAPRGAVTLQERHAAMAFQEALFERVAQGERGGRLAGILGATPSDGCDAVKVQNDIRTHVMKAGRPAFVEETFVSFEEAFDLVLELGGIPCYPVLADGATPLCAFEEPVEKLIERIKERNIRCVEFIPPRNDPRVLERYVRAMREAGLVVTAGTEHNTLDLQRMTPACRGGAALPGAVEEIFGEGARVVAAHEFLGLHGRCGFVDRTGALNGAYATGEALIEAMARAGGALIERAAGMRNG